MFDNWCWCDAIVSHDTNVSPSQLTTSSWLVHNYFLLTRSWAVLVTVALLTHYWHHWSIPGSPVQHSSAPGQLTPDRGLRPGPPPQPHHITAMCCSCKSPSDRREESWRAQSCLDYEYHKEGGTPGQAGSAKLHPSLVQLTEAGNNIVTAVVSHCQSIVSQS